MALEISEFTDFLTVAGEKLPVPDGQPVEVHTTTGAKTLGSKTCLIRITGSGTITWPNTKAEIFVSANEVLRGVRPGTVITIS